MADLINARSVLDFLLGNTETVQPSISLPEGLSGKGLSDYFGVHPSTISRNLRKGGVDTGRGITYDLSDEKVRKSLRGLKVSTEAGKEYLEKTRTGLTKREIAEKYDMTITEVNKKLKERGITASNNIEFGTFDVERIIGDGEDDMRLIGYRLVCQLFGAYNLASLYKVNIDVFDSLMQVFGNGRATATIGEIRSSLEDPYKQEFIQAVRGGRL